MHSSAAFSLLLFFFRDVPLGVGESGRERPAGTGTDGTPAGGVWLRLSVCELGGDMGCSSWLGKGIQRPTYISASVSLLHKTLPQPSEREKNTINRPIFPTTADHRERRIFSMHFVIFFTKCIPCI